MKKILGISAFYHDSAAAILVDGQVVAAAQEERFTRKKQDADFPVRAITYCLEEAGLRIDELDAVVFYEKPLLKFERLLQTYYAFAPRGLFSFLKAIPVWLNEKLFFRKTIQDGLQSIQSFDKKKLKLLFPDHHLSHAASAFYPSPFDEAAILTIDGVGEWSTATISHGKGKEIQVLREMNFPHSLGLLYSAFTYFLGFKVNSGEYKIMGLAPYGNPQSEQTTQFKKIIQQHIVDIKSDGSIWLNQTYFRYSTGLKMIPEKKWEKLFKVAKRTPESSLQQIHANLALAIQQLTEEIVIKMATEAKRLTKATKLCLAGGVALNCVANYKLQSSSLFDQVYIQPAAGDAGGALGAALSVHYQYFSQERLIPRAIDFMQGSYLGPQYASLEIQRMNRKFKAKGHQYEDFDKLCHQVATILEEGAIVAWFQGRMEFGPRALGNRSILADPRNPEMQVHLNKSIKKREGFRPFAPSILEEDYEEYFPALANTSYMLTVAPLLEKHRTPGPNDRWEAKLEERASISNSPFPSVTHLDYSARVQSVSKKRNPRFWKLLKHFKLLSGCGMLINTSFNQRGEPIVASPEDAFRCFMSTGIDYLVIEDFLYAKKDQIDWENTKRWQQTFAMD